MKTIQEFKKESLKKKCIFNTEHEANIIRMTWYVAGVDDGVQFAQQWIPVEQELPDKNTLVIAKNDKTYWIATLQPNGLGLTLYSVSSRLGNIDFEATHWRYIELKEQL